MHFQGANDSRLVLIYGTQKKMRWFRLGSIMSNGKRLKITYGESSISYPLEEEEGVGKECAY